MLVKDFIKILETKNQDAHVLINGYEYGFFYLHADDILEDKFNYVINDVGPFGGLINPTSDGDSHCILFQRKE
jgi:hypothetical protein